ncbi:MAG: peroxiredoxin family protein [Gemmataceae bacterium]
MARGVGIVCLLGLVGLVGCFPGHMTNQKAGKEGYFAPPIEAVDGNGQPMRLSDYPDKVVLLSFWHSQCPPCRAMFSHEKELVKKFKGKPFVLLGVNADESPYVLKRTQDQAGLTWPSFWDGVGGSIAASYSVDRYPAFFIIDREGIVRWRSLGVPPEGELEKRIEENLAREK